MNGSDQREEAVFEAALKLQGAARAAYLEEACAEDPALRARIEGLLGALDRAGHLLSESAITQGKAMRTVAVPPAAKPGDCIGHYKLLQQIGEGGCGVVYMAEQTEPIRRRVALKILKLGMDTKQVIARFEAERQALALMDHPHIAKVFDAGATDSGRPYFVMELVRGVKITNFCDENKLSTTDRLKVFVQVCQAIQHAHQKGIIHRDIKPSNILVTVSDGVPVPKVIDFGIAKATAGRLTDQTLFTAFEQFIGTPAYMSPEQAVMTSLDIDTRSDIYSLGVLLYELLTGKTPFDQKELLAAGLDEMRRIIRENEPMRPSTRLSTMLAADLTDVAKYRHTEAPKLTHLLRGDLDWIVMKALEKDRARRYETANGFAGDIERHLNNQPVVARPPSRVYEFQKTVRRHKFGFAAAAAILLALAGGITLSMWQALRATRAEREQFHLRRKAEEAGATAKQQEQLARRSADKAREQQNLAVEQELLARRRFYAAQMNLAMQAWAAGDFARTLDLLETQRPAPGKQDSRGFEWYHLWGLCNANLRHTLIGHHGQVLSVTFSRDGKTLASCSGDGDGRDGSIRLWDVASGRELRVLRPPRLTLVNGVAFTPDGKTLATCDWANLVLLWDVPSGQLRATLTGHARWVRSLAISRDGNTLASGADDGVVKLWNLPDGSLRATLPSHKDHIMSLAFLDDDKTLAVGSGWGGPLTLWDLSATPPEQKLRVKAASTSYSLGPDGKTLATAAYDSIQLVDTSAGKLRQTIKGPGSRLNAVAFLPDKEAIVSCSDDRLVRLWKPSEPGKTNWVSRVVGAHLESALSAAVAPDGVTLATGANDGSVKLWNIGQDPAEADKQLSDKLQAQDSLWSLFFSPDGGTLFQLTTGGTEGKDMVTGRKNFDLPNASGRGALSPDGKRLAVGPKDGTLRLWDRQNGQLLFSVQAHPSNATAGVNAIAFSGDGKALATGSFEGREVRIWDTTLKNVRSIPVGGVGISALAFSTKGNRLAVGVRHIRVLLYDASTGKLERTLTVESGFYSATSIAFSPQDELLAVGCETGAVKLWDVETGQLRATLKGHTAAVKTLAFSPDGNTLASGSGQAVRLWDAATGQECGALEGFRGHVRGVAFSPDGNVLVAGSSRGEVKFWRANRLAEAELPPGPAEQAARLWTPGFDNFEAWRLATHPDPRRRDGALAIEMAQRAVAATKRKNPRFLATLAAAYAETGQNDQAITTQQEAIALLPGERGKEEYIERLKLYESGIPYRDGDALIQTIETLLGQGNFTEAELRARECLSLRETMTPNDWRTFNARTLLGGVLLGQKKFNDEAEQLLISGYEGMKQREDIIPAGGKPRWREALQDLALFYEAKHRPDQASAWKQKLAEVRERPTPEFVRAQPLGIPPRQARYLPNLIDLSAFYTAGFKGNWAPDYEDNDLSELPVGFQVLAGTQFDVRGLIQLCENEPANPKRPEQMAIPLAPLKCRRVHFLHGAIRAFGPPPGTVIGIYVFHYTDGVTQERPIVLGKDVLDWWTKPPESATKDGLNVAWSGYNGRSRGRGRTIQLYQSSWENPRADTQINRIDFISTKTNAAPFLVAITVE